MEELPVVGMKDAAGYYERLKSEQAGGREIPGVGDRAFERFATLASGERSSGVIIVLKGERLFVFDFGRVREADAKAFAARTMERL